MRSSSGFVAAAALSSGVLAQSETVAYTDAASGLTYASYTNELGITINIAVPEAEAAPFDMVLQFVAPRENGWVGLALGGTMTYNPLALAWPNDDGTIVSSRMAYSFNVPQQYDGAEFTQLTGTASNATHWIMTARCQGCSQWTDVDNNVISLDSNGENAFSWAQSAAAVADPASNSSLFNAHDSHQNYNHNLALGRNADFDTLVEKLLPREEAPPAEPEPTEPPAATTMSTVIVAPTGAPAPKDIPTSCQGISNPRFQSAVANGYRVTKIAGGLRSPRSLLFDAEGHLLVTQTGLGITSHTIGANGCVTSTKTVISQNNLNHGIALSPDGKTLYASSATTVWRWTYDPVTASISGQPTVLVKGMLNQGHITRTLAMHPTNPNYLVVSHGSNPNIDHPTINVGAARANVKVFDLGSLPNGGYDWITQGKTVGYGLRNGVGITFDKNANLWEVENSSDNMNRVVNGQTTDIHIDNPAEELNYLGDVTPSRLPAESSAKWYGYPLCFTVGDPSVIRDRRFTIGDQLVTNPNATFSDNNCIGRSIPPALTIQAHSAPMTGRFDNAGDQMYISLHGSWNRQPATGFKLVTVPFQTNSTGGYWPTSPVSAKNAYTDLWWNPNTNACSASNCFRPCGVEVDKGGRVFVTSDAAAEGEIFILGKI